MYAYSVRLYLGFSSKNATLVMLLTLNNIDSDAKCNKHTYSFLLVQFLAAISTQTFTLTKA